MCVAWLKEQFDSGHYELRYVPTAYQAADIYTKGFDSADKWQANCRLIGRYAPSDIRIADLIVFWRNVSEASMAIKVR